jgi:hypothetical protein
LSASSWSPQRVFRLDIVTGKPGAPKAPARPRTPLQTPPLNWHFWSISVYNAKGYFEKSPYGTYSLNNITAKRYPDGAVTIQFGGCDGQIPNCLPTMPGWNYLVRFYRPHAEILNGKWKFPEPQVVK